MAKLNTLIILVLTATFTSFIAEAQTECSQKFKIENIKNGKETSSFKLSVNSKEIYSGQLIELVNTEQQVIQKFSGQGDQNHSFKNIKNSEYRIILEFKNEQKFLCKRRMLTIDLTDSSKTW